MKKSILNLLFLFLLAAPAGDILASEPHPLRTLEEVCDAFTHGLSPDLSIPAQRDAFNIYRCLKFGDPKVVVSRSTIPEIANALQKFPELEKNPFRNYKLLKKFDENPVTPELKTFCQVQLRRVREVIRDLYWIESNPKFWKKILKYEAGNDWNAFLESKIPTSLRLRLQDENLSWRVRGEELYRILSQEYLNLKLAGKDARPMARALIDILHTLGYQDESVQDSFENDDGLVRIQAFREVLKIRDQFALELGIIGGFQGAMKALGGVVPTGIASETQYLERLNELEKGVLSSVHKVEDHKSTRTVRHLSTQESPLRSCLGKDCSTSTYLLKALDPNFHYFTLTDHEGKSSGQVTLVLGDAVQNDHRIRVAFIDKVQNVENQDLAEMLEAIRLSVLEQGYILVLPRDVGDHNGISNEAKCRKFLALKIPLDRSTQAQVHNFWPHQHGFEIENRYSRAYDKLPCLVVLPQVEDGKRELSNLGMEIQAGTVDLPWKSQSLSVEPLLEGAKNLKNSKRIEERLRYIPTQEALRLAKVDGDPDFDTVVEGWLKDPQESFPLRKQALLRLWIENRGSLLSLLESFNLSTQIQILQNFLNTPTLRWHLSNRVHSNTSFVDFLVRFRSNPKLVHSLLDLWMRDLKEVIAPILDFLMPEPDLSDVQLKEIVKYFTSQLWEEADRSDNDSLKGNFKIISGVLGLIGDPQIEKRLKRLFFETHFQTLQSEEALGRFLVNKLQRTSDMDHQWLQFFLDSKAPELEASLSVVRAFRQFFDFSLNQIGTNSVSGVSAPLPVWDHERYLELGCAWMALPDLDVNDRISFLMAHLGSGDDSYVKLKKCFDRLQSLTPRRGSSVKGVPSRLQFIHVFEDRMRRLFQSEKFKDALQESFEFMSIPGFEGVEIQKTPVSGLQWVMLKGDQNVVMRYSRQEYLKRVSAQEALQFIKKLNRSQSVYHYRLPTDEEWNASIRVSSEKNYLFNRFSELTQGRVGFLNSKKVYYLRTNPNAGSIRELDPQLYSKTRHRKKCFCWEHGFRLVRTLRKTPVQKIKSLLGSHE